MRLLEPERWAAVVATMAVTSEYSRAVADMLAMRTTRWCSPDSWLGVERSCSPVATAGSAPHAAAFDAAMDDVYGWVRS